MQTPFPIPGFSDPFSSISHLLAAGVFLVLAIPLIRRGRGNGASVFALCVFAFAAVFMLSMSGVYHLLSPGTAGRAVLQRLDHCAIFVLIVGTMTPIHQILFRGFMRWAWLLLIWTVAITALTLTTIFFTSMPEWLTLTFYLSLGWLGVVTVVALASRHGWVFTRLVIFGGLAYSIGAILDIVQAPVLIPGILGPHELFHIAVLMGLGLHWRFIYNIASPAPVGFNQSV